MLCKFLWFGLSTVIEGMPFLMSEAIRQERGEGSTAEANEETPHRVVIVSAVFRDEVSDAPGHEGQVFARQVRRVHDLLLLLVRRSH